MKSRNFVFVVLLLASSSVFSGEIFGKITRAAVVNDDYYMVMMDVSASSIPSCATDGDVFSINRKTESGKEMLPLILTALISQKSIQLVYSDQNCGLWGIRPLVSRVDIYR